MNGAVRCPCKDSPIPCLSCRGAPSGSAGTLFGVRPVGGGVGVQFRPDAARDRALQYTGGGYMRSGYDTGR